MDTLSELKREAKHSVQNRGHKMGKFHIVHTFSQTIHRSYCKNCKRYIDVIEKPQPNEINIGGNALAVLCMDYDVSATVLDANYFRSQSLEVHIDNVRCDYVSANRPAWMHYIMYMRYSWF